jgi:hypothetical protein
MAQLERRQGLLYCTIPNGATLSSPLIVAESGFVHLKFPAALDNVKVTLLGAADAEDEPASASRLGADVTLTVVAGKWQRVPGDLSGFYSLSILAPEAVSGDQRIVASVKS